MGQIITAMFDSRSEAEAVQNELRSLGILKDDNDTSGAGDSTGSAGSANRGYVFDKTDPRYREGAYSNDTDRGFWSDAGWDNDDTRVPDEDRHLFEEGVHRGKTVLTVTVDDAMADRAREVLERSNAHDIDTESSSWRNEGWTPPSSSGSTSGAMAGAAGAAAAGAAGSYYTRDTGTSTNRFRTYRRDTGATGMAGGAAGTTDAGNGPGEVAHKAAGYANEAIGNVKQAIGNVVGSDSLRQSGIEQERKGENQQERGERLGDRGNEL